MIRSRFFLRRPRALLLSCGLAILSGCGGSAPELGLVEGVVRLDGRPLANARVTFVPSTKRDGGNVRSTGDTDSEGRFELRAETLRSPGAVVGRHVVIVVDKAVYSAPRSEDGTILSLPPRKFPAEYGDPLKSPLKIEISPGQQEVTLDLNSQGAG